MPKLLLIPFVSLAMTMRKSSRFLSEPYCVITRSAISSSHYHVNYRAKSCWLICYSYNQNSCLRRRHQLIANLVFYMFVGIKFFCYFYHRYQSLVLSIILLCEKTIYSMVYFIGIIDVSSIQAYEPHRTSSQRQSKSWCFLLSPAFYTVLLQ